MFDTHAAAVHDPVVGVGDAVGVGVGLADGVGVGVGGEVADVWLANATVYAVKSQGFCVTLLQSLEVTPLFTGLHSRSRLTDQNVYLLRPELSAKASTVWKSLW